MPPFVSKDSSARCLPNETLLHVDKYYFISSSKFGSISSMKQDMRETSRRVNEKKFKIFPYKNIVQVYFCFFAFAKLYQTCAEETSMKRIILLSTLLLASVITEIVQTHSLYDICGENGLKIIEYLKNLRGCAKVSIFCLVIQFF